MMSFVVIKRLVINVLSAVGPVGIAWPTNLVVNGVEAFICLLADWCLIAVPAALGTSRTRSAYPHHC